MMKLHDTEEKVQRFLLVGVGTDKDETDIDASLDELAELLRTAGGEECGRVTQNLESFNHRTYVGSGKVEEIKAALADTKADGIICDDELTPAQLRNLGDELNTKVIDRSLLILDIFSQRASTREGQMQVELAQLEYRLTRLTGLGTELSRQGAAVGTHTRGAGETKLELDRRYIRSRIAQLKADLKEVAENRERERGSRRKSDIPVVALVGYTNAGKSTLFNRLTDSGVLEEDELFATLDTTVRRCELPDGRVTLLSDTVGFIHKLPAHLVKAFRSTLEEANEADLLLHVVDASHPMADLHMKVTYEELVRLGAGNKPIITVLNKQDKVREEQMFSIPYGAEAVIKTCALDPKGREKLIQAICDHFDALEKKLEILIPYTDASMTDRLHREAVILEEEYTNEGVRMVIRGDEKIQRICSPYEIAK
ncbi:MAG: GTPase HflX [Lachnospiraceae bacterium]|nr:GTPase HflX [Lachnospiraceae bacterium]